MKRVIIGLLVLAVGIILVGRLLPSERVYAVATVVDGLRRHPGAWAGRTILVRGLEMGETSSSVCSFATTKNGSSCRQTTWLHLGALESGASATTRVAYSAVSAVRAVRSIAVPTTLRWGTVVNIYVFSSAPQLHVLLRPGAHAPTPAAPPGWLSTLHALPVIGPTLTGMFPWDGAVTVRVYLASHPCRPSACEDGILVGPS